MQYNTKLAKTKKAIATAGPLASKSGKFTKILEKLNKLKAAKTKQEAALSLKEEKQKQLSKLKQEVDQLNKEEAKVEASLLRISNWEQAVSFATSEISRNYHPYNLDTGETRTVEDLSEILESQFETIKKVVKEMNISKKCLKRIEKAYKLVPQMLTTLRFYFNDVDAILDIQSLPLEIENIIRGTLAPALYLEIAGKKMQTAEKKHEILKVHEELIGKLKTNKIWQQIDEDEQFRLEKLTLEFVQVFQRSSSCVEGRNSHLRLWHHGVGTLSSRKLKSITVVHNYFLKRGDGTTAAERFFGKKPKDLFQYLLNKMPCPVRPRQKFARQKEVLTMAVI